MARSSVRRRLLAWLMPPLLALWFAGALLAYWFVDNFANRVYDRWLLDSTVALAQQVHAEDGRVSVDLPSAALRVLEFDTMDRIYYQVTDARGGFVVGNSPLVRPEIAGNQPALYDSRVAGEPVRVAALRVEDQAGALVEVAETLNKRRTLTSEILAAMLLPQLLLIAAAAVLIWNGVGRGLRPLEALRTDILGRSHRDLKPLDESRVPSEVAPLVYAINQMLARLESVLVGQNRFIADAAHQLRTPLAGLKTQAELALRETRLEELHASLEQIQRATDRSARIVNQLLALARADCSLETPARLAALDLVGLAREATADWVAKAVSLGLDLGFDAPEAVPMLVLGNAELLRELIDNLVDNALRYTPAGGQVTVRVARDDGAVRLEVEDTGPGIPPGERERVFERFHRIEGSPGDGCGLGLPIVAEIAHAHGAAVTLHDGAQGRGTLVRVRFPAA